MRAFHFKGGSRFSGLLFGGLAAGALGLTFAAGASSSSPSKGSAGMAGAASLPPNVIPGWKIRVCSEKTKADQIHFKFTSEGSHSSKGNSGMGATGTSGSSGMGGSGNSPSGGAEMGASGSDGPGTAPGGMASNPATDPSVNAALSEQTARWSRGEASEISLPAGMRDADKIRIEATPAQKDKKASICVIYDDHVAKELSFDDREVSTVKSTDKGACGC